MIMMMMMMIMIMIMMMMMMMMMMVLMLVVIDGASDCNVGGVLHHRLLPSEVRALCCDADAADVVDAAAADAAADAADAAAAAAAADLWGLAETCLIAAAGAKTSNRNRMGI